MNKDRARNLDATKGMLNVPTVLRIVDILEHQFPLGSEESKEIVISYINDGETSITGLDLILEAIADELPNIEFNDITDNEGGIIPFYIKKLGMSMQEAREKVKQGLI